MMCLIAKSYKPFTSAKFKHTIYKFDKTDPKNLILAPFIENIKDEDLHKIIPKMVEKYRDKNYVGYEREELEDMKDWNDLEVLLLLKFYKNGWSFIIPDEKEFFPSFSYI